MMLTGLANCPSSDFLIARSDGQSSDGVERGIEDEFGAQKAELLKKISEPESRGASAL